MKENAGPGHHEPLRACDTRFDNISTSLAGINDSLKQVTESTIRTEESLKSVWHEFRLLREDVTGLFRRGDENVQRHQSHCPAFKVFLQDAANKNVRHSSDPLSSFKLPKVMLWTFVGIGVVVGVACYVLVKTGVF